MNSHRRLIRRADLSYLWRRGAARAGVEGFTPHDLRHYAASVLIEQGASVKSVQKHLGHASATTTLDVYSHWWPDSEDVTRPSAECGTEGHHSPTRRRPCSQSLQQQVAGGRHERCLMRRCRRMSSGLLGDGREAACNRTGGRFQLN